MIARNKQPTQTRIKMGSAVSTRNRLDPTRVLVSYRTFPQRWAFRPVQKGRFVSSGLLAHLAPLGWQHINLTGDYLWGADSTFGSDGFRPLRGTLANPIAVAA